MEILEADKVIKEKCGKRSNCMVKPNLNVLSILCILFWKSLLCVKFKLYIITNNIIWELYFNYMLTMEIHVCCDC